MDFKKLTVAQLREELTKRGLDTKVPLFPNLFLVLCLAMSFGSLIYLRFKGLKNDLIKRLEAAAGGAEPAEAAAQSEEEEEEPAPAKSRTIPCHMAL